MGLCDLQVEGWGYVMGRWRGGAMWWVGGGVGLQGFR